MAREPSPGDETMNDALPAPRARAGFLTRVGGCVLALAAAPLASPALHAQACTADVYRTLDFWIGEWDVFVADARVGTDRVEKVLGGCAVMEHWTDARGSEGKSLFWVEPGGDWRQVWVTDAATAPGGTKEKRLVERVEGGGVRFQGEVPLPDGGGYLDRTTLTPLDDGRVRQVIEVSGDGGRSWTARFDAVYVRTARTTNP